MNRRNSLVDIRTSTIPLLKVVLISFLFIISATTSVFSKNDLEKAEKLIAEKKYSEAEKLITAYMKTDTSKKETFYMRGLCFLYQKKYTESKDDFTRALELDSTFLDAMNSRSMANILMEQFALALADVNKVISIDSTYSEAYLNRATVYMYWSKFAEAAVDLDKSIKLNPRNPEAYYLRGTSLYKTDRIDSAIDDYSTAIKMGIKTAEIFYERGNAYYKKELYRKAISDFNEALKISPDFQEALNNRALAHEKFGNVKSAEKDRKRLLELVKKNNNLPDIEDIVFKDFVSYAGEMTISLPQSWIQYEKNYQTYSNFLITINKVNSETQGFSYGVRLTLNKEMLKEFGIYSADSLYDFWVENSRKNIKSYYYYKELESKKIEIGNYKGTITKVIVQLSENSDRLRMLELVVVKDNALLFGHFQALHELFDYYELIFNKAIESLKINY